jgi:hypothetical protein
MAGGILVNVVDSRTAARGVPSRQLAVQAGWGESEIPVAGPFAIRCGRGGAPVSGGDQCGELFVREAGDILAARPACRLPLKLSGGSGAAPALLRPSA